jgi:radical SAM superfamily enzyme YgiQ (UPF0313 family)
MNKEKIFTQACFIIGYPGETNLDLKQTKKIIIMYKGRLFEKFLRWRMTAPIELIHKTLLAATAVLSWNMPGYKK